MKLKVHTAIAALLWAAMPASHAQQHDDWPTRSVRWIVPFAAGGTADATARHIAHKLTERWGQQVVVHNKPGGNTVIAAAEAARATPDGYTLFQPINSTLTINPFTFSKLPYDPMADFSHIGVIANVPLIIVANDTLPAATVEEMVELARKTPGTVTVGGGSVGMQLAYERFVRDAGVRMEYIPYNSGADVTKGLLSGEIQAGVDGVPAYPQLFSTGKLRPLATNSSRRIASLPDVPTLAELGYRNSEAPVWHGLVGPRGLPDAIRDKIAADLKAVLAMPDLVEKMDALGLEAIWEDADAFVRRIETESGNMGPLVKELGIKMN